MHDLDAGRIFWKEWRAQRSFWLALIGMSVGLDVLLTFVTIWNQLSTASQLGAYNYVAIVLACSFATGSAAIAFAGEIEEKRTGCCSGFRCGRVICLSANLRYRRSAVTCFCSSPGWPAK